MGNKDKLKGQAAEIEAPSAVAGHAPGAGRLRR